MKDKLRWIIPVVVILILSVFLVLYYFFKPRLVYSYNDKTDTYLVDYAYGNGKEYTIPEKYNGKYVTGINVRAFYKHSKLEKIVFENKEMVKTIGRLAFSECPNLKEIDLSSVELIERNAFAYDTSLNNLTLSCKHIASSAFYKCTGLNNITLNEGVESIGVFAFSYCTFSEIKLPKSINVVYDDAFKYQSNLTKISVYYRYKSSYISSLSGYEEYYD